MDTRIIIVISAALFSLFVIVFLFRFILLYQKKTIAFTAEKKMIESKFQQELLVTQLEIQEQTLKQIAQEIHDNIGGTLSLVKLNLARLDDTFASPLVDHSKELLTTAIANLRVLSRSMHSDTILEAGLLKAIAFQLQQVEKSGVFETQLRVEGEVRSLPQQHELILFRIVQEAVNNIIKHAEANCIEVDAGFLPHQFMLQVKDNGKGFTKTPGADAMAEGIGLRSMHNRVQMLHGDFYINSAPDKGTTIQIKIPA